MFKQIGFVRKRPDISTNEFVDYYEGQHSKLGQKIETGIPNAIR